MATLKSQSAMEYLMTYGWSILAIAIVIAGLFKLGLFSSSSAIPNSCVAQTGFLCSGLIFNASTNNGCGDPSLSVNLGIITTSGPLQNVYFIAVPQDQIINNTTANSQPNDFLYWNTFGCYYHPTSSVSSGQVLSGVIYISPNYPGSGSTSLHVGTSISGRIWIQYSTSTTTNALAVVGTFTAIASTG